MFFNCFLKSNQNSSFIFCNRFFTFLSFTLLFEYCSSKTNVPSTIDIKEWANSLELRLAGHLENISGIKTLDSRYADVSKANVLKVEGLEMAKDMARELNENFNKKKQALINLVNTAEEAVSNYHDKPLTIGDVSWVDVDDFKENDSRLTYDERFKKGVNMSYSGVHIPLEIYEGYQEILNGLNWSSALDVTFAENQRRDPNLLWQYFGSQAGFMRQYPASKWNRKHNIPDLYDVRRRPWYIHGSSSPKDMLILMDTSGSMHGQTMDIMRNSVKNILDTLGEDDFVNVAKFNNVTNWVSCFDTFVQATWRNKYTLIQEIDNLKDNQMAKLQIGLNFSFAEFDKFEDFRSKPNNHWVGANCHKVIVIFTDGGTEDAGDIVKKWNRDKRIRIFTFAVGPHPVPYATLKQVACKNKGYFSSIPSMGATRTRVQDYVKVLSRPMVLSKEKEFQWTNFYKDVLGLGVLTTVTLPVFNKSDPLNQSLVGVMGVDIPVQELVDKEPSYKLGPGGYSFALNHNGLVVFHPDLPTEVKRPPMPSQITAVDDSPHVDFLDVEFENDKRAELRRAMIDRESGQMIVDGLMAFSDEIHVIPHSLKYFYTPVINTSFSLALVVDPEHSHYITIKNIDWKKGINVETNEVDKLVLAPWKYCNNTIYEGKITDVLNSLNKAFMNKTCDHLLFERLLWDIERSKPILEYWREQERTQARTHVVYTFFTSEGGLSWVYPPSATPIFEPLANPRTALYYKRATFAKDFVFLIPQIEAESMNESRTLVPFVKTLRLNYLGKEVPYKPGVVGGVITSDLIKNILMTTPENKEKGTEFERISAHCGHADGPKQVICYLVDDGGYVIVTNQNDDDASPGSFLGEIDSELMSELKNKSIFKFKEYYSHEELCDKSKKINAASSTKPFNPLKSVFKAFSTWNFSNFLWNYYYFFTSFSLWTPSRAAPDNSNSNDDQEVCTKLTIRYYLDGPQNHVGKIVCEDMSRNYSLSTLFQTNLMLIVSTPHTHCHHKPLIQQPSQVEHSKEICHPKVRYRRRPGKCFASHYQENTHDCGRGNVIKFSIFLLELEFAIIFLISQRKILY